MDELNDELGGAAAPPPSSLRRSNPTGRYLIYLLVAAAMGGLGYWAWMKWMARNTVPVAPPPTELPKAAEPPPAVNLTEGNELLQKLGAGLSDAPEFQSWLKEPDLLRRLVAASNLVAEGNSPRSVLGFVAPNTGFEVEKKGKAFVARETTYARMNVPVKVFTGTDPAAVAKQYEQVAKYADAAFGEIGQPGTAFISVLHKAVGQLLAAPVPKEPPELEPKGIGYAYQDEALERLPAAQKAMLRLGPANEQALHQWLESFDHAMAWPK